MPQPLDYRPPHRDKDDLHSIENEPHLRPFPAHAPNLNDPPAPLDVPSAPARVRRADEDDALLNNVWDEPALSKELGAAPADTDITYARWLAFHRGKTSALKSWLVVLAIALVSGPWAVVGAFWGSGQSLFSVLALVAIAPAIEELMKTALATYVAERRPYLFRGVAQILLCGIASGIAFAAIENLLYLNVYIPNASPSLIVWRWTVCVALHSGCTLIASLGVARIWRDAIDRQSLPRASLAAPYLFAATIVHGTYNAFALLLEWSGYAF